MTIHFQHDSKKCLLSKGIDCNNCVQNCLMKILAIKEKRVVLTKPEECILCHNCQGACLVDLSVIKVWEEE